MISIIGSALLVAQTIMITLYLYSVMKAQAFTKELIILNSTLPMIAGIMMLIIAFKFSGSPLRAAIYSQKLKLL